jgi:hypothetical protein
MLKKNIKSILKGKSIRNIKKRKEKKRKEKKKKRNSEDTTKIIQKELKESGYQKNYGWYFVGIL